MIREFDQEGLRIATFQARLFEESAAKASCSSPIFLRRAMKSDYMDHVDHRPSWLLSLDTDEAFSRLEEEYGPSDYGHIKYSPNELHWIGWMYRYICYTRNATSRIVYSLIKPDYLKKVYYVYHTQSEEWAFSRMLESLGLSEDDFDINQRLKKAMREAWMEEHPEDYARLKMPAADS